MSSESQLSEFDMCTGSRSHSLAGGGFSAGSFLFSVALHVALVLAVLLWPRWEHRPNHLLFPIDLANLQLAEPGPREPVAETVRSKAPPVPAPLNPPRPAEEMTIPAPESAPTSRVEASPEPVAEVVPSPPEELPSEEVTEQAEAGTQTAVSAESTAPATLAAAQAAYQRAVAARVTEVAWPWAVQSSRWMFRGWISFHLCLDAFGNLRHAPVFLQDEEGIRHMDVRVVPEAGALAPRDRPQEFLNQHFGALVRSIQNALANARPYPLPPPGMVIPENMAFPIELNVYPAPGAL